MVSINTNCLYGHKGIIALAAICFSILFSVQSILTAAGVAATPSDVEQAASPNAIERAQKIIAIWEKEQEEKALHESPTQRQFRDVVSKWKKNETREFTDLAQQMIDIAESKPEDVGARDALLWIVSTRAGENHMQIKQRAVSMLLDDYVNDPEVARSVLSYYKGSAEGDLLVDGVVSKATDHESLGLAKLALAKFLKSKADLSEFVQSGKHPNEEALTQYFGQTYVSSLRSMDVAAVRERAEQLLEEVNTKYGDIPFVRNGRHGAMDLARKKTLAQGSQYMLDEMRNLVVGKVAPGIDGRDLNDQPLNLADFHGKVVVLVFWASWCGPCMAEVPHELELVEQFSGMPFTILGINCDVDKETAQNSIQSAQISWPNWHDGFPTPFPGPIVEQYHVKSLPTVFVLDAKGTIRAKNLSDERLELTVRELLNELESASEKNNATAILPSASP